MGHLRSSPSLEMLYVPSARGKNSETSQCIVNFCLFLLLMCLGSICYVEVVLTFVASFPYAGRVQRQVHQVGVLDVRVQG